jgi:hypothetical protein
MGDLCEKNDFFKMLNNDSDSDSDDGVNGIIDRCLISRQELNEHKISLPCNHSFNYIPLYTEIVNQKKRVNLTETVRLRYNQIKCPYCRTIHNYLIPYIKMEGVSCIHGVNTPRKYVYYENTCEYIYKRGTNKGKRCSIRCSSEYCNSHLKHTNNETVGNTNIKKKKVSENEIVSSTNICSYVFKRGTRKGEVCGKAPTENVENSPCNYCKLHNK